MINQLINKDYSRIMSLMGIKKWAYILQVKSKLIGTERFIVGIWSPGRIDVSLSSRDIINIEAIKMSK